MGNGLSQCLLCGEVLGFLGSSSVFCKDCRKVRPCSGFPAWTSPVTLWLCILAPRSVCVCVYIRAYMCAHMVSYASWQEGLGPEGQMARLLGPALGSGPLGLTGLTGCEFSSSTSCMTSENLFTMSSITFLICKIGMVIICTSESCED